MSEANTVNINKTKSNEALTGLLIVSILTSPLLGVLAGWTVRTFEWSAGW